MSTDGSIEQQPEEQRHSLIQGSREYLRKVIKYYLGNLETRLPKDGDGVLQVLSVGCSFAYEAQPVISIFPNSHFKGIDTDQTFIDGANTVNRDLPSEQIDLVVEDARETSEEEKDRYGLVIMRHPQVGGSDFEGKGSVKDWRQIIESSIQKTTPQGFIFITTQADNETRLITKYLKENNVNVLFNNPNLFLDDAPTGLSFRDPNIIIGQRIVV